MENYEMMYPYYDPPLKVPNILDPNRDERAKIDDVKRLEKTSIDNCDLALAETDYELRFGSFPNLEDYWEGPYYRELALRHGGRTAVMQECLRRNIPVSKLWKINDSDLEWDRKDKRDERIKKLNERREWLLEQKAKLKQAQ